MTAQACTTFICWLDAHSGAAAWAQAFFSVAAIWFAGRQGAKAFRRQQQATTLKTLNALLAIIAHTYTFLDRITDPRNRRGLDRYGVLTGQDHQECERISEALVAIPINEMASYAVVKHFLQVKKGIGLIQNIIGGRLGDVFMNADNRREIEDVKIIVQEAHEAVHAAIVGIYDESAWHLPLRKWLRKIVRFWQ